MGKEFVRFDVGALERETTRFHLLQDKVKVHRSTSSDGGS
jgi:hypothetical protein